MCGVHGGSHTRDWKAPSVADKATRQVAALLQSFRRNNTSTLEFLKAHIERWREAWRGRYSEDGTRRFEEPLAVAVGVEYSYPHIAIYDYEQLVVAYLLSLSLESIVGTTVRIVLVGSDSTEVNRYNINPLFRAYFQTRRQLAHVVADLAVEPTICALDVAPQSYLGSDDLAVIRSVTTSLEHSLSYVELIRRAKLAVLGRLSPLDGPDFARRVEFSDFPVDASRHAYREPLRQLLAGLRTAGVHADVSLAPMQAYRSAIGKAPSPSGALGDDPFVAFCPRCGAGSSRVISSHYYPTRQVLRYHCQDRERRLYPNYTDGIADTAAGCGLRYSLDTSDQTYLLDTSGRLTGYPRFALATAVVEWPIWVMESTDVVSGGLLRSMIRLRDAHAKGSLGQPPSPVTPLAIVSCRPASVTLARDMSAFNLTSDERIRLASAVQCSPFRGG